ncbi:MAG: HAD-IA family hydrolase [Alphaproteobacteria bacterium]|nr:HAD-IA family hydrolase [Alphaproteobacteria bacterium]
MTPRPPALVVFDCDGTLVDSQHAIVACMAAAFESEGAAAPAAGPVRRVIGLPLAECVARLGPDLDADRHERIVAAYKEHFFILRQRPDHHEPLFPGALEALDAIERSGARLGIATGKARRGLLAVLERHGLGSRFVTMQTGDIGPGKPHPAMLERAMEEAGCTAAETVMIGDTVFDIQMARSAGAWAVGVAWGYHEPHELAAAGAHRLVEEFAALPGTLAGQGG